MYHVSQNTHRILHTINIAEKIIIKKNELQIRYEKFGEVLYRKTIVKLNEFFVSNWKQFNDYENLVYLKNGDTMR